MRFILIILLFIGLYGCNKNEDSVLKIPVNAIVNSDESNKYLRIIEYSVGKQLEIENDTIFSQAICLRLKTKDTVRIINKDLIGVSKPDEVVYYLHREIPHGIDTLLVSCNSNISKFNSMQYPILFGMIGSLED